MVLKKYYNLSTNMFKRLLIQYGTGSCKKGYSTKLNATNCLITEGPSLMFSIVKVARDQFVPGSLLTRSGGR